MSTSAPLPPGPEVVSVAFVRLLRRAGLAVPVQAATTYVEALAMVDVGERSSVYWAGRATLVRRTVDRPIYDAAFASFWDRTVMATEAAAPPEAAVLAIDDEPDHDHGGSRDPDEAAMTVRFSRLEELRHRDFAACTPQELRELHRAVRGLRLDPPRRRSRRLRSTRSPGRRPDLRRTLRSAARTGGDPVDRRWLAPRRRHRRLVLLVDVSASMEPYTRSLARFAHAAVTARRSVEAFAVGTRLTRLTRTLSGHDPDVALAAAAAEVSDWSGGTRLGDGLRAFNDRWGARGLARGAVVIVLSDGWDRGDPDVLAEQMARLARVAHRIIWVNPLQATAGYEPLARGMAAALPHVDNLVAGHSLAALEDLARLVIDADDQPRAREAP